MCDWVTERLAYRFSTSFSRETVERYVADSYRLLAQRAKAPHHLVSLTTKFAGPVGCAGGGQRP